MDIHRLKFLDVKPQTVLSLAFNESDESPKIAASRGDGSIEIWSIVNSEERELTYQVTIPGQEDISVEKIIWCNKRLFSAGLSGNVCEWDLVGLSCSTSLDTMGSPAWCLDADSTQGRLAVGTDNGKICIYDTADNILSYSRSLENQNCRILSISWHLKGANIVVGCSDSTVRIINAVTGHCTLRISIDKANDSAYTMVWGVKFLSDYTIVTGSSNGKMQFWNGQYGTLKHSYQSHSADILTLAVNREETTIYASGVDSRVVQFKRVNEDSSGTKHIWTQCQGVRAHLHDVKSLAVASGNCLVSGGVDTALIVYHMHKFDYNATTKYSPFLSWGNRFMYASSSNILMYQSNNSLKLWKITPKHTQTFISSNSCSPDKDALKAMAAVNCHSPSPCESNNSLPSVASSIESEFLISSGLPVNFLEIKTSTVEHILSSTLSDDGRVVVLSSPSKVWVYGIGSSIVCISCSHVPAYCSAVKHDGSEMALGLTKGGLTRVVLPSNLDKRCSLTFDSVLKQKDKLSYSFCQVLYSPCGNYLLTLNKKFRMFIYETASFACLAKVPRLDDYRMPRVLFDPFQPLVHIFTSSDRELHTYNIKTEVLELAGSVSCPRHRCGGSVLGNCMGFCATSSDILITYDSNSMLFIKRQSKNLSAQSEFSTHNGRGQMNRKRKRIDSESSLSYKIFDHCKEVLFVSPMHCGELLVVEKPWAEILSSLPPPLERKQYAQ